MSIENVELAVAALAKATSDVLAAVAEHKAELVAQQKLNEQHDGQLVPPPPLP